eukprot:994373-Karenia_brevis.AAC.1
MCIRDRDKIGGGKRGRSFTSSADSTDPGTDFQEEGCVGDGRPQKRLASAPSSSSTQPQGSNTADFASGSPCAGANREMTGFRNICLIH